MLHIYTNLSAVLLFQLRKCSPTPTSASLFQLKHFPQYQIFYIIFLIKNFFSQLQILSYVFSKLEKFFQRQILLRLNFSQFEKLSKILN